jgi:hypothetical protein
MAEDREDSRQIGILRNAAREWKRENENPDYLPQGTRLVQMEALLKSHAKDLTETEIEFLKVGIKLREKKLRQKRIINRVIIILGIAAILLALFAFYQKNMANRQYKKALVNGLASEASLILPTDNIKAIRIAGEAYKISLPDPPPRVMQVLSAAAFSTSGCPFYTANMRHNGFVNSAVFSPDGTRILTASRDNTAKLWYTPEAIIEWLKTANIPQLSKEEKKRLGIE